ncbi:MAG: S41 family peptidase [Alphaproteobacteria bacterium]|jgi:carboxyl-terminal processing protease|nr:S41 family peptidase [Alphaproteobacteria bacterium]
MRPIARVFALSLLFLPCAAFAASSEADTYKQLNLFGDVFERVRNDYVEEKTDKELVEAAINGMLTHLDPHSSYLDADGFKDMQVQTKGEFGGLGIEVTQENGFVKVISPIDETPAARAGVKAGDLITHLDGEPVVGLTLQEAVERMRGLVGTALKITIRREGVEPFDLTLTRDVIKIRAVRWHREGDIGYIRITSFNDQTQEGLDKALKELPEQIGADKVIGYVLDLRNNPGGLLEKAISVSDTFLDKGEIVSTRGRQADDAQRYNAKPGDKTNGLPLVVLINDGSASASEIVAGALQDQRRAILVGTKTFGKGSVQTIIPLPGHGAMRLTTARYYTPSGRSIQAKGIEPDIDVPAAKIEKLADSRLRREADLRGALSNPDEAKKPAGATTPANDNKGAKPSETSKKPDDKDKKGTDKKDSDKDKDSKADEDYQLARGLDIVRGISLYENRNKAAKTQ